MIPGIWILKALEKAFEKYPDCKVVITVNLYGTPGKLDEIKQICEKHHAVLIEDGAESLGASYKGKACGSFGEYNAISFNGNKIITTSGGGMLLSDNEKAIELARKWSTQSREKLLGISILIPVIIIVYQMFWLELAEVNYYI